MAAFKRGALIGFAVGYVYGSKAGRERYEQINRNWEKVKRTPLYQRLSVKVAAFIGLGIERGKIVALSKINQATGKMKDSLVHNGSKAHSISIDD